jgi:transcription elongation factor Elf1
MDYVKLVTDFDEEYIEGHVCKKCESKAIKRIKKKDKQYAICESCGSEDILATCPECNGINIKSDIKRAELYCFDCGLVLSCHPHWVGGSIQVRGAWSLKNRK